MKTPETQELQSFSVSQMGGLLLAYLRRNTREAADHQGHRSFHYYPTGVEGILEFEILPIWNGNAGTEPLNRLRHLFNDAITLLNREDLIRPDLSQSSSREFFQLTSRGESVQIRSNWELRLMKSTTDVIEMVRPSVLHLVAYDQNDDPANGTCFIIDGNHLLTCKHNLDLQRWEIHFPTGQQISGDRFVVHPHPTRDLAILSLREPEDAVLFKGLSPLLLGHSTLISPGDTLIAFGYPDIPSRYPIQLHVDGIYQGTTRYYNNDPYVTMSNPVQGGYSGGPVLSLYGEVVAVTTQSTGRGDDTNGAGIERSVHNHGTPIEEIFTMLQSV
ncbi:serine protease [Paenibacillus sp. FSL H8-0104]|uniref:S1 family peptidase n=1 Tax=Paenibacillus sp. FSL H8-0104 TaxID=2954509 RepID=UPI0030FD4B61